MGQLEKLLKTKKDILNYFWCGIDELLDLFSITGWTILVAFQRHVTKATIEIIDGIDAALMTV